jgi:hypothetical protein
LKDRACETLVEQRDACLHQQRLGQLVVNLDDVADVESMPRIRDASRASS